MLNTNAFRNISYGLYVVASLDDTRPIGCIANSIIQVTSDPATLCVSLNKNNYTHDCIKKSGMISVNILPENIDTSIIGTFGFSCSADIDKFKNTNYKLIDSVPVLADSCGYITGKLINSTDCGTHTIFIVEVVSCDIPTEGVPMTYSYYHTVIKGSAPKNAPTYLPEEKIKTEAAPEDARYICNLCSYEYVGSTPFEDLPNDFVCPICGQKKFGFDIV